MRRQRAYGFALSFQDMLMAMIAIYAFLFLIAFALIKPADAKPGIESKAEYMISLEWPPGNCDDLDLHLLLPDGKEVNFKQREVEHAMLDHDDLGTNGVYRIADGTVRRIPEHKEVITLRAIVPGTYVANVHVYALGDGTPEEPSDPKLPFPVKVTLTRLNPIVVDIAQIEVLMTRLGEQRTAFQFLITERGDVKVDREVDMPFIQMDPEGMN
jgi:hypothetical protein